MLVSRLRTVIEAGIEAEIEAGIEADRSGRLWNVSSHLSKDKSLRLQTPFIHTADLTISSIIWSIISDKVGDSIYTYESIHEGPCCRPVAVVALPWSSRSPSSPRHDECRGL